MTLSVLSLMKIKINEISNEGLTLTEAENPTEMQLQTPELQFVKLLQISATFQKQRDSVVVDVKASGEQELLCGRCLALTHQFYENEFRLGYSVKGILALDITDDVRQEILLSYPVQFLCKEECLGLCARCGKNLNEGPCACPQ